jgi:hypothetical protein
VQAGLQQPDGVALVTFLEYGLVERTRRHGLPPSGSR